MRLVTNAGCSNCRLKAGTLPAFLLEGKSTNLSNVSLERRQLHRQTKFNTRLLIP